MQNLISPLFYYVKTPTVSMRKEPKENSLVVSQAYFSEQVHVVKEINNWTCIETAVDSYQGWVPTSSLCSRKDPFLGMATVNRCAAHLYDREDTTYGPILTLPFDSKLDIINPKELSKQRWQLVSLVDGHTGYIQSGDITLKKSLKCREDLKIFSLQFLNLPYTWGGRSSFGYDCSGFVQMLYRHLGFNLPRDAKDQISWEGFSPTSMENLQSGDLLFWGASITEIYHVAMYLENKRFIHATVAENAPYIRISYLSDPEWNGSGKWTYKAARTLKII